VLFVQTALCSIFAAFLAVMMCFKVQKIVAAENNKTLELAKRMNVSLLTEEEVAVQASSKKIFFCLMILSAAVCACCGLEAFSNKEQAIATL